MPITTFTKTGFSDVQPSRWNALANLRFFFAHQSVGADIVDGMTEVLAARADIPLRVIESATSTGNIEAGFFHARLGRNGDVRSKCEAFAEAVRSMSPTVAMLKYCYVDIDAASNPDALFDDYRRRMDALRAEVPQLTIVHATMPLTDIDGRKARLMSLLGRGSSKRDLNAIRNRYNDLLRDAFARAEPVFDIAEIESTRADGSRTAFLKRGQPVYHLAPELTHDGGHLNAAGKRAAAEGLLALLASIS